MATKKYSITKKTNTINVPAPVETSEPISVSISVSISDNWVMEQWRASPVIAEFLLRNAYCAMLSQRAPIIFSPYPESWNQSLKLSERAQLQETPDIKTMIKANKVITDIDTILSALRDSYNDAELLERLQPGHATYELVRFILAGNKMLIRPEHLLNESDVVGIPMDKKAVTTLDKELNATLDTKLTDAEYIKQVMNGIVQFKVEHTALVEDRFQGRRTIYLYHGSRAENWYSIMANGLKSGSKSKYFLNGATYGNGIYLSNDIHLSLGYSSGSRNVGAATSNSEGNNQNMILAIFQVLDNPKWHKTGNIYVVDNEDALVLRYLLVINNSVYSYHGNPIIAAVLKAINIKLNSGGIQIAEQKKKEMEARTVTTIHNKRLMREYQAIMKQSPDTLGFQVRLVEDDQLGKWMIHLARVDNPKLEEQMRRLGIPAIEIEVTFKENYPIAPPFIRVVYPHFKFHSGHITVGGSLCMEMLTNQGWSPTFNVENVITQIKMAIADGGGEIDEANYKRRYTMDEALEAFKRVMASHGWV